jgi:hypothetical protein
MRVRFPSPAPSAPAQVTGAFFVPAPAPSSGPVEWPCPDRVPSPALGPPRCGPRWRPRSPAPGPCWRAGRSAPPGHCCGPSSPSAPEGSLPRPPSVLPVCRRSWKQAGHAGPGDRPAPGHLEVAPPRSRPLGPDEHPAVGAVLGPLVEVRHHFGDDRLGDRHVSAAGGRPGRALDELPANLPDRATHPTIPSSRGLQGDRAQDRAGSAHRHVSEHATEHRGRCVQVLRSRRLTGRQR